MREYDAVFIYKTDKDKLNSGKEIVKKEFSTSGIKILKEEDMGDRELAYPIKKDEQGHYIVYTIQRTGLSYKKG